jgi:membrane protease YdiL (CAAX protease family)
MSLFDENHFPPPDQAASSEAPVDPGPGEAQPLPIHPEPPLACDPLGPTSAAPGIAPSYDASLPEDLRISWSWLHFLAFIAFVVITFFIVQVGFLVYYAGPLSHLSSKKDFEQFALSKPIFAVGSMVLLYGLVMVFLYVSLSVLPGSPFWRTLGWRKIIRPDGTRPRSPWLFFLAGCGLSLAVLVATYKMQPPEDVPVEELFHYKNTAMLFMAMAVLIAPLVEETVFRGYLYPLFAKSFGVVSSVILTGILFGLMHGAQLGWTWGLVLVLVAVGVIFTLVRARTGSVYASFLLHLGYNSMIAVLTILGPSATTKITPTH